MHVAVMTAAFDPIAELAAFETANLESGATASFVGRCRSESNGIAVERLELEHYPGFTEATITAYANDLASRLALSGVAIIHRVGPIAPGEAIVLVAAASAHRREAFKAVEELMNFLKIDAPFWKREITARGVAWVEPTLLDYHHRASRSAS
jgi:molybdopterin synthase catalytic subunit